MQHLYNRQARFRDWCSRNVAVETEAYEPDCACARARVRLSTRKLTKNGRSRKILHDNNQECGIHAIIADTGMLQAHDEIKRLVPGALVLSQVAMKSQVTQGRSFETGQYTCSPDIRLDLLVQSPNQVFCAIEVSGREHNYGSGPDRDRKKTWVLYGYSVPLLTLELSVDRTVPLEQWRQCLLGAQDLGWLSCD